MANDFIKRVRSSVKHWYLALLVGILLICTGIWTLSSPLESYVALSMVFSISFLISGILEIVFALSNREELDGWGWTLALGILTAMVGILLLMNPEVSLATLPFYVGFLVMFRSIGAIGTALDLKNYKVLDWGTLMVIGILGLLFSFILLWNPVFAGMTVVIWTGIAFLVAGVFNVYLGFKLRNLHKNFGS